MKALTIVIYLALAVTLVNGQTATRQALAGASEFLQACKQGNAKQVGQLLQANPQLINVRQIDDGATPLHLAKNAAVAAILLENGADLEAVDTQTQSTPLHWALDRELWEGKSDTAAYLMDQGARSDDLLCLCALGKLDQIKARVAKDKAPVNFVPQPEDQLGGTPLDVACCYGQKDVVEYLLENGANVNKVTGRRTALHDAAFLGRIEIVKILLAHGANMEAIEGKYHESPLGWAVYAGQTDVVKFLLDRGAKVRMIDLHDAISGKAGQNQAGRGATAKDYAEIETLLRPKVNASSSH